MLFKKINPELIGAIREFLDLKWSYSVIIKHFSKKGIVRPGLISKIKKNSENNQNSANIIDRTGRKCSLNNSQLNQLKKMVKNPNPPTQSAMVKKLNVSRRVIGYQINDKHGLKLVKKPKGQTQTKCVRNFTVGLGHYLRLRSDRWKKFITTYEAWFFLSNCGGKRRVQYINRSQNRSFCEQYTIDSHPNGLKKAVKQELKNIPQDLLNRTLKSWPKRCRRIYYNKVGHIVKHN
jgi:hypothetical protein